MKTSAVSVDDVAPLREVIELLRKWQQAKRDNNRRTALVIELAGMPKAGKSSVIENLRHFFSHGPKMLSIGDGFRVNTPAEGVYLRTPNYLKENRFDFNIWAGAYGIQELQRAAYSRYYDLIILDRGPWDAGCWLECWKTHKPKDENIPNEIDEIIKFFQLPHWMTRSDLHVVLTVSPEKAADRESKDRLVEHNGATANNDLMKCLHQTYIEKFKILQKTKSDECNTVGTTSAIKIDTDNSGIKQVTAEVVAAISEVIKRKLEVLKAQTATNPKKLDPCEMT